MTASVVYEGQLHCKATHIQSGSEVETDAPTDNREKEKDFLPPILFAWDATCIITTMGIKAQDMNIELAGTTIDVQKHMALTPDASARLMLHFVFQKR
jgi:hypothetical protein